jgi:hypothetical protein
MPASKLLLCLLPLLFGLMACTRQETLTPTVTNTPTPIPVTDTPQPTATATNSPMPEATVEVTELPLAPTREQSIEEQTYLVTTTLGQALSDGGSNYQFSSSVTNSRIVMTVQYQIPSSNEWQMRAKWDYAGERLSFAICALRETGLRVPPIAVLVLIHNALNEPIGSYIYCANIEGIYGIDCASPEKTSADELLPDRTCPIQHEEFFS